MRRSPFSPWLQRGFQITAILCVLADCPTGLAAFVTTGVYDENVVSMNVVDVSATSDGSETVSLTTFTNEMFVAHGLNRGGVIDFDSGTLTDPDTIDASYGPSNKQSLTINNPTVRGMEVVTAVSSPAPISGNKVLKKISGSDVFDSNDFIFDFDSGDQVVAVGATILWQVGFPSGIGNVTGFVRYSDTTSSAFISRIIPGLDSANDTFWGFRAPAGKWITQLQLTISNSVFAGLDDLAFILAHDSADFDVSGTVDGIDFLILQRGYLQGTTHAEGDANGDGAVNQKDVEIWQSQYGIGGATVAAVAPVPEPTTCTLALAGLCLATGRRRRQSCTGR